MVALIILLIGFVLGYFLRPALSRFIRKLIQNSRRDDSDE